MGKLIDQSCGSPQLVLGVRHQGRGCSVTQYSYWSVVTGATGQWGHRGWSRGGSYFYNMTYLLSVLKLFTLVPIDYLQGVEQE